MRFRDFLENIEEKYDSMRANIPLPQDVYTLSQIFSKNGLSLIAVGGVVRDYLYSHFHGGKFSPKDVDLATEAPPQKVLEVLSNAGIKTFPKGEAFGVVSAVIGGTEYEIATFREDGEYTDGRRPDSVSFSTPAKDAKRRDLTYNALFYYIQNKEIRDYNLDEEGNGLGLQDIKNLKARPVGLARDRFREDKLRIPRLIRFFSRFNPGFVMHHLDKETLEAIQEFKDLAGVSPERISAEFIAGLEKSISPANYLKNYEATGLIPAVFPGLLFDSNDLDQIGKTKNTKAILAWVLKHNDPKVIRSKLNKLKYSNEMADSIAFLIRLYHFNVEEVAQLLKQRDLHKQLDDPDLQNIQIKNLEKDVMDFAKISGREAELEHFLRYQPTAKSQDFMHLSGKAISDAMRNTEIESYKKSLGMNQFGEK